MTHKRRIIYMTDPDWRRVQDYAASVGLTASAIVRNAVDALVFAHVTTDPIDHAVAKVNAQAERDRILSRINKGKPA